MVNGVSGYGGGGSGSGSGAGGAAGCGREFTPSNKVCMAPGESPVVDYSGCQVARATWVDYSSCQERIGIEADVVFVRNAMRSTRVLHLVDLDDKLFSFCFIVQCLSLVCTFFVSCCED